MKTLGTGFIEQLISRRDFLGGYHAKELHRSWCECSYCCKVANNPSRGKTQFWAPSLKYWLVGWWVYVQVCSDGPIIYTRYTLPQWVRPSRWW